MLLMKKDMGGAASALALGHMIMSAGLDVRLRMLIPAAENAIAGNAFRPGDVLRAAPARPSRSATPTPRAAWCSPTRWRSPTRRSPITLIDFATLTGAARVALGPDLPPFFTDDDALRAARCSRRGLAVGDPVWRMPFWTRLRGQPRKHGRRHEQRRRRPVRRLRHRRAVPEPLRRKARRYAHFDIYGWRPAPKPLGPKGGEPQAARAVFEVLRTQAHR